MGIFSNREIATAIWLIILILFGLPKKNIRSSLKGLIRSIFAWKLTLYYLLSIVYFTLLLFLINRIIKLDPGLIKDSIIWFIASGLIVTANAFTLREKTSLVTFLILDNLKLTVFVEFVIATYVFSLPVELIIIPLITFISLLSAFIEVKKEYEPAARVFDIMQSATGFIVIGFSVFSAVLDYNNLIGLSSIKSFILPFVLMLLYFPFSYLYVLYVKYDEIFTRVNVLYGNISKRKLGGKIKRKIFFFCGLNYNRVNDIRSNTYYFWHYIENEKQIDELIYHTKHKIKKIYTEANS